MNCHGKKIGIMGGTFNPIHMGHLILAQTAREQFGLEQVLIMPSGISYQKADEKDMASKEQRLTMAGLAIAGNEAFRLCTLETDREGNTYTCDTLRQLHEMQPETAYYFIMGLDSLFGMESWLKADEIFRLCTILAAVRDEATDEVLLDKIKDYQNKYGARIEIVRMPGLDISSRLLRNMRKQGRSIRYYVPDSVWQYIDSQHLYQS